MFGRLKVLTSNMVKDILKKDWEIIGKKKGRKNFIPSNLDKELFYEQANRMLGFLGYEPVEHTPVLKYVDSDEVLKRVGVEKQNYIVFHLCSSHPDRSLPLDRWQKILLNVREKFPDLKFVFTGSVADKKFINEVLNGLNLKNTLIACGERSQDLLNIYAKAKLNITVHTGNAILINELHVPTIILNIKGIYMFKYYFNEKSTELVATEGCRCDPYERDCALVEYKGQGYMACLFNIKDQDVVDTIVKKLVI